ncbi:LysE family translocator [Rhodovibrionaceae bacterium A322]
MSWELWLAFVAATSVFVSIPGPAVLVVVSQVLRQGVQSAWPTGLGVLIGDLIIMGAAVSGLGLLLNLSADIFTWLRWAGAAYLIYLGVQAWRDSGSEAQDNDSALLQTEGAEAALKRTRGFWARCTTGLVVNLSNPKTIIFFLAFFPQFMDPQAAAAPQLAILTLSFLFLAGISLVIFAVLAGRLSRWMVNARARKLQNRLTGSCLIAAGLGLAVAEEI